MREEVLISRVKGLIEDYSFNEPFANYLKVHFRKHPEMGARDRRETREWAYNILRIGMNLREHSFEKRLAVSCFLCSSDMGQSNSYLINEYSGFNISEIEKTLKDKLKMVVSKYPDFKTENIFQMHEYLSPLINKQNWYFSFLKKPLVWIRLRETSKEKVIAELNDRKINFFADKDPLILSFNSPVNLEITESYLKGYFEIQDKSSQLTKNYFHPKPNEYWWDACAGSGGKSLLLVDECREIKIFASDVRSNILENYSGRMKKSGFKSFQTKVIDLGNSSIDSSDKKFDGIIVDVPCSGSGTWARSPEWLQKNFSGRLDNYFVPLQRRIISSVYPSLKPGFPLIYITCSVFKKENEENIQFFIDHFPLKLEKSTYLEGFESQGDTLFVARFVRDR